MKQKIQSIKGTRDFYPEEMAVRSWLYQTIGEVSASFGYQEWEGPFLESIDLYAAKSGDELVKEQSFVFPDRGGDLITLRPELTPTLARMVAQRQNELVFPLRWWSYGPMWRYERPQKGRTREFFQWNIDLIGVNSPEADAELIAICACFFEKAGLKPEQAKIHVNDRRLINSEMDLLNIPSDLKKSILRLIDRRDKMSVEAWEASVMDMGLSQVQLDGLKTILADADLWRKSPELVRAFSTLEVMGANAFVRFNPQIIRGLDYYTGIVFEGWNEEGGRALLGGGHYDNLVADVGGDELPGVGFAMGDIMMPLVLKKYGLIPTMKSSPADVLVTVFDESRLISSFNMGSELRRAGLKVMCYPQVAKLPKQLKYADQMGIRFAVIMGPDEEKNGQVTVKDLGKRTQETIVYSLLVKKIKQMLAQDTGV